MAGRPSARPPDFVKARSGIQPDGTWQPQFDGQREPFAPGNDLHLSHGAYVSPLKLAPRAAEIAEAVRATLPLPSPAAETVLYGYGLAWARVERASLALEEAEASGDPAQVERLERLGKDMRLWLGSALAFARELGLSPASQARIFRDASLGRTAAARSALREHLETTYGDEAV